MKLYVDMLMNFKFLLMQEMIKKYIFYHKLMN